MAQGRATAARVKKGIPCTRRGGLGKYETSLNSLAKIAAPEGAGHALGVRLAVPSQAEEVEGHLLEPRAGADLERHARLLLPGVPPVAGRAGRHVSPISRSRYRLAAVDAEAHYLAARDGLAGPSGVAVGDMRLRNIGIVGYVVAFLVVAALLVLPFHRTTPQEEA